jgi:uncharacterized protein (DUF2126 family)/transglutaminase-like putative cysteine protease
MTIRVGLNHRMTYRYDRKVSVGPQIVRLRPAVHCKTPIRAYSLKVEPADHFVNWQQDPHGNFQARFVFPKPTDKLDIQVDLVADMTVVNPFDFFIEEYAEQFPFQYEEWLINELRPFLEISPAGPLLDEFVRTINREQQRTVLFLVELNCRLQKLIRYLIRLEPGVQSPEETLEKGSGSCRDSAWLLVQVLRRLGLAARFVSGYLIQLVPDVKSLDGPSGPEADFTDLHAWTEVFLPGAGWVGLDPTSGLFAGEGHIPLACTPSPSSAAPVSGTLELCETQFAFAMQVTRVHEDPRVTKPYTDSQWAAICRLGDLVDERLISQDVRLTMGGEPTFVSVDEMDGEEWNTAAVGPHKRKLSEDLIKRIRERFAAGGLLHYGQGKWYPGESLPRWALACFWRNDGIPIWHDVKFIAEADRDYGHTIEHARTFAEKLSEILELDNAHIFPAFEDAAHFMLKEQQLPVNVDPLDPKIGDPEERSRMIRVFERGLGKPVGLVIPMQRQWWQAKPKWTSGKWPFRRDRLFLLPGDSPIGLRLPLDSLVWQAPSYSNGFYVADPTAPVGPLPVPRYLAQRHETVADPNSHSQTVSLQTTPASDSTTGSNPTGHVKTALCVEPRDGRLHVFMPPVERLEDYLDLIAAIEATAHATGLPIIIEGYLPPHDSRVHMIKVTPDPGVIEVNTNPTSSWRELVAQITDLYDEARATRLGTEKFDLDGKHTGTGGGNHVVVGGRTPADSPFLRRPDLLKSLVGFWINHPSLSYLFSGRFIGPTSQAPRVDEGRRDSMYELKIAFSQIPPRDQYCPPWLVDRVFRNLLTDLTGNTHRAEFCIDKLYSPDSSTGRLGLVEFRGFEMPPHAQMSLTQQLLIRALISIFWNSPYEQPLIEWGTSLHDRFMLPHFNWSDFGDVLNEVNRHGIELKRDWFGSHFEFRFPKIGEVTRDDIHLELRAAIEPWNVLGEEPGGGGTVRFVDSSVERLQVKLNGMLDARYAVTCNGRRVPLHPTGQSGQFVGAVRYRAWQPPSCLHPLIPVHTPLVFDLLDTWSRRSIGGCMYHVAHPAGRNYQTFPVNAYEAEARRSARFSEIGYTPGTIELPSEESNPEFPLTLDLRRSPVRY